ncbi:unnamed protein product [Adineta steineri]|uniref:Uncharacterized protein n=2 Tax=Adineta steineri TaxID=433720 RepID=A0A815FV64_9BILA|nr:unnamed protein product [Adineta steineri]CAF3880378.1 unnamed protein product [Adineta steineri]
MPSPSPRLSCIPSPIREASVRGTPFVLPLTVKRTTAKIQKSEKRSEQMLIRIIVLYVIVTHVGAWAPIPSASITPTPLPASVKVVYSEGDDSLFSCSIKVTPEGWTIRALVPAYECQSSPYEFCCNEVYCNHLPSPPLPALTSLKCTVSKCTKSRETCIPKLTTISSATESCSARFGEDGYRYYKKGCQPTISGIDQAYPWKKTEPMHCCNSPKCNIEPEANAFKGIAIQCYTCDSRITGLEGCMLFDESSPHVYKAGSSSREESCATIIGLTGRDSVTGTIYPDFAIRTFIPKCVNQNWGTVSYGGATFWGRIECCANHLCNKEKPKKGSENGTE